MFFSLVLEEFLHGFGDRMPGRFVRVVKETEETDSKLREKLKDNLAIITVMTTLKVLY